MGLADLWNLDKKVDIENIKREMRERDQIHAETVSRREAEKDDALKAKKKELERIQDMEFEEQQKLNDKQKQLESEQKEMKILFDKRLASTSATNNAYMMETQNMFIDILKTERDKEHEDKRQLTKQQDYRQLKMEEDQQRTEKLLNERRKDAESEKLTWNNERLAESHQFAREIDETNTKHFASMREFKTQKNHEEVKGGVQGVVFELRDAALNAVYKRGKAELMTAYGKDINQNDKRRAITQIKNMSLELHSNIGKIVAKINAASTVEDPTKVVFTAVMKLVQKCLTLANTMKSELTSSEILQMDSRDSTREVVAYEADSLLGKVARILGQIREIFESGGSNIKRSIDSAKLIIDELDSTTEEAYRKVRDLPLPSADHEDFDNVILKTMDAISGGGNVATDELKRQLMEGRDFARRKGNNMETD